MFQLGVAGYTSSYPGEGTVAYTVGGQLVARKVGTDNWINYDDDLNPIAQEDGTGGGIGAGGDPNEAFPAVKAVTGRLREPTRTENAS